MKIFPIMASLLGACSFCAGAFAADLAAPAPPPPEEPRAPVFRLLSLTTATTRRTWDKYTEGTAALGGSLVESGIRGRLGVSFGRYDYPLAWSAFGFPWSGELGKVSDRHHAGSVLLGYELVTERYALLGLVGAEVQHHGLSEFDPQNAVHGTRWGFKVAAEIDSRPFDNAIFYASGSYSTAFQTAHVDVRPGYLAFDRLSVADLVTFEKIYVGPHGAYDSDRHDQIWKAGAHLTIPEFGPFRTTVAAGYAHDRYNRGGAYGLVETAVRF